MIRVAAIASTLAALVAAGALARAGYGLLSLPGHDVVAESIAGGGDTRSFASALRLFDGSVGESVVSSDGFVRRARAEAALTAQHGDARIRSRAETLLGVLVVEDALGQHGRARALAAAAAADAFRTALRLDPENEQAAIDLELLLSSRGRSHGRHSPKHTQHPHGGPRRGHDHRGSASNLNGSGY